jgi:hypothetical protein
MAAMAREVWADERVDELTKQVDPEFVVLRREMNESFDAVDIRCKALQRTMIISFSVTIASICASATAAILASNL